MFGQCCCAQDEYDVADSDACQQQYISDPLFEHNPAPGAKENVHVSPGPPVVEEAPQPPDVTEPEPNVRTWRPKNQPHLQEFEVIVDRAPQQDIGITFVAKAVKQLPVVEEVLEGGLIDEWNMDNGMLVKPSTYIIEANGKTDPDDILQECDQAERLTLWMERKTQYTISMPEKKKTLGLDLQKNSKKVLQLTSPNPDRPSASIGLFGWNHMCNAGDEVRRGDEIISANGVSSPDALLPTITQTSVTSPLVLIMSRGP